MSAADWVARHLGRELSEFQRGAVDLICDAMRCGPYDFAGTFAKARWEHGRGVSFVILGQELATFDSDGLTRLVVGAHDRCYRVSVEGCAPRMLRVSIWPRERAGAMHKRHPTMEDAVRMARRPSHGLVQGAPELEPRELDTLVARLRAEEARVDALAAEVDALRAVLVRARRGLAWASEQRPELAEDYAAVDAAITQRETPESASAEERAA